MYIRSEIQAHLPVKLKRAARSGNYVITNRTLPSEPNEPNHINRVGPLPSAYQILTAALDVDYQPIASATHAFSTLLLGPSQILESELPFGELI
jgi:hypothetical protein